MRGFQRWKNIMFGNFYKFGISNLESNSDKKYRDKEELEKEPEKERPSSSITSFQFMLKV